MLEVEDTKNKIVFVFKVFGSQGRWIIAIGQYNIVSVLLRLVHRMLREDLPMPRGESREGRFLGKYTKYSISIVPGPPPAP